MFGPSSVFENSIWWQFRIRQEKSTPYDKALLLLGNRLKQSHPKSPLNVIKEKKAAYPQQHFLWIVRSWRG